MAHQGGGPVTVREDYAIPVDPELPNPPDEAQTGDIGISEPDPVPDDTEPDAPAEGEPA